MKKSLSPTGKLKDRLGQTSIYNMPHRTKESKNFFSVPDLSGGRQQARRDY